MGFKKTSEGRVFFQGADDGMKNNRSSQKTKRPANIEHDDFTPLMGGTGRSDPQTQIQIITLLKTLNERLKVTQAERNKMAKDLESYKGLLQDLKSKSDRNEKAYIDLEQKLIGIASLGDNEHAEILARDALRELEETRKTLLNLESKANRADKGVTTLKKLQQEQAEKMTVSINHSAALTKRVKDTEARQEQMNARVEDAFSQQARLTRKIDKAIEERARFMRKLERIEETVLQTRDSLNAKAMVLLTDQGVAAQTDITLEPSSETLAAPAQAQNVEQVGQTGANKNTGSLFAASAFALIVVALAAGLFIGTNQNIPRQTGLITQVEVKKPESETLKSQSLESPQYQPPDIAAMEWSIEEDTSAFSQNVPEGQFAPTLAPVPENDDLGTLDLNDQAQVEALLSENPDAVASALNAIEPSNTLPENIVPPETVVTIAQPEAQPEAQPLKADQPPSTQATAPPSAQKDIIQPARISPTDPIGLIKPDSSLPDTIKALENQAFKAVPEAQHDLAAIYTAGHGGVAQDYKRAAFWFEQAASRDVANAAYNLGVLNHQGLGTKADLEKAISWYKRAATLRHPEAQYNLGIAYIEGIGVPYDAEKAADYFASAAENNIMEAAYNLGLIYENGLLGNAKPDQALLWYKTAADQGSPEARQALNQLAQSLNVSIDDVNSLAESMKAVEKSAASQSPATQSPTAKNTAPSAASNGGSTTSDSEPASASSINTNAAENIILAQIQEYLLRMGLYPGPADGINGPLTQDAIRSYQRQHNLSPNGAASESLLSHMLANAIGENVLEQGSSAE